MSAIKLHVRMSVTVAGPSKVCISSRWIAEIAGSNPADGMDVRLLS